MLRLAMSSLITLAAALAFAAPIPQVIQPSKNVYSVDVNLTRNDHVSDSNFTVKANQEAPTWATIKSEIDGNEVVVELKSLKELSVLEDGRSQVQAVFSIKEKQEDGSFKVLSNPTVSTIENEPALVSQFSEGEDGSINNSITLKYIISKKAL